MIQEAEKFAEEDKATAERITARNGLENYAFNLKNQVNDDDGLGGKIDEDDKETVSNSSQVPLQTSLTPYAAARSYQGSHRLARGEFRYSHD